MFQIGELVMHPGLGVCRVENVRRERFAGTVAQDYYVLRPIYDSGATVSYIPVNGTKVQLRKALSAEEIRSLIRSVPRDQLQWIENDAQRKEQFAAILREGDRVQLIALIVLLHERQLARQAVGKRLRIADENVLRSAERLIHQEFASALSIRQEEVAPYIMAQLGIQT